MKMQHKLIRFLVCVTDFNLHLGTSDVTLQTFRMPLLVKLFSFSRKRFQKMEWSFYFQFPMKILGNAFGQNGGSYFFMN